MLGLSGTCGGDYQQGVENCNLSMLRGFKNQREVTPSEGIDGYIKSLPPE